MIEEWRDVVGYDDMYKGYYQVSSLGRVRGLDRSDNAGKHQRGRILKQSTSIHGYKLVGLSKNGEVSTKSVHRLVTMAFLENEENKPYINHKDENKKNNNVDNLEWVTPKENSNYGTAIKRRVEKQSKPIKVIYQDDTYEIWESASKFAREYGNGVKRSNVVQVLSGDKKSHHGLRFEYV